MIWRLAISFEYVDWRMSSEVLLFLIVVFLPVNMSDIWTTPGCVSFRRHAFQLYVLLVSCLSSSKQAYHQTLALVPGLLIYPSIRSWILMIKVLLMLHIRTCGWVESSSSCLQHFLIFNLILHAAEISKSPTRENKLQVFIFVVAVLCSYCQWSSESFTFFSTRSNISCESLPSRPQRASLKSSCRSWNPPIACDAGSGASSMVDFIIAVSLSHAMWCWPWYQ